MCYKYVMFGGKKRGGEFGFGVDGLVGKCHGKKQWRLFVVLWTTVRWEVKYKQLLMQLQHSVLFTCSR